MKDIAIHYSEEEWESDNCEQSGVRLLVVWNTISVNDHLEGFSKSILLEKSWLYDALNIFRAFIATQTLDTSVILDVLKISVDIDKFWNPAEALHDLILSGEHVEMFVDSLFSHDQHFVQVDSHVWEVFVIIKMLNQEVSETVLGLSQDVSLLKLISVALIELLLDFFDCKFP